MILACLLLAGIGCGSDEDPADPEAAIRELLDRSFVVPDPSNCGEVYTQALMEQLSGETGEEAVAECREDEGDPDDVPADSLAISDLAVEEAAATASVRVAGGDFDGSRFDFEFVETDEGWRMDTLSDVVFNRDTLARAIRDAADEGGLSVQESSCFLRVVLARQDQFEEAALSGFEDGFEGEQRIVLACLEADTLRAQILRGLRTSLESSAVPPEVGDCVVDGVHALPDDTIGRIAGDASGRLAEALGRRLLQGCATAPPTGEAPS